MISDHDLAELEHECAKAIDGRPGYQHARRILGVIERLRQAEAERDLRISETRAIEYMLVRRLGGKVEGRPTSELNYLQRVDELRAIEKDRDRIRAETIKMCADTCRDGLEPNGRSTYDMAFDDGIQRCIEAIEALGAKEQGT